MTETCHQRICRQDFMSDPTATGAIPYCVYESIGLWSGLSGFGFGLPLCSSLCWESIASRGGRSSACFHASGELVRPSGLISPGPQLKHGLGQLFTPEDAVAFQFHVRSSFSASIAEPTADTAFDHQGCRSRSRERVPWRQSAGSDL